MTHHNDTLRPGEVSVALPVAEDAGLRFVGVLQTPFKARGMCPHQGDAADGPECVVALDPVYAAALTGLNAPATVQLVYWLHEARRDLLVLRGKGDRPERGAFATRAPLRPNPIGISTVALLRRESATRLIVRGLDCLDGTPLLDIKPVHCGEAVRV